MKWLSRALNPIIQKCRKPFQEGRQPRKRPRRKKLATRKAAIEKKLVQPVETQSSTGAETEAARIEAPKEGGTTRADSLEDSMDHVPRIQRRRKVVASPELVLLEDNKGGDQGTSNLPLQTQPLTEPLHSGLQRVRDNLFLEGASSTGVKLLKQMLLPAEEAHLKGCLSTPELFEGSNLILSGVQMLVSAFEEVAAVATKEDGRIRDTQELYEQLQEMVTGIRAALDTTNQQLSAAHIDLAKTCDDVEAGLAREESLHRHISALESKSHSLTEEIENQMSRAIAAETALATSAHSQDKWRASFLQAPEFKTAVEDRAYYFFRTGFDKCQEQFEEVGLFPEDREDFPNFERAIASFPQGF